VHNDILLAVVVVTALAFDFTNGFHDTANAMATSIATGALPPKVAVALSAVLNIAGAFLSIAVATTIAKGIVNNHLVTLNIVFAGLIGAILWNLLTWLVGLPSSSSHALIGGLVGATLVGAGTSGVDLAGVLSKVIIPALIAPVIAAGVATLGTFLAYRITSNTPEGLRSRGFRYGQIGSASLVSLAHGTNDAQKTMGIITLALIANGTIAHSATVPLWVIIACASSIAAGTYIGGWRIIRTMGVRLVEIEAPQGFAAEGSSSAVLLASAHFGLPLSTTHIAGGSIIGSGLGKRLAAVRWGVASQMVGSWVLTLPAAAAVGALWWQGSALIGGSRGVLIMAIAAAVIAGAVYAVSRREPVNQHNVTGPRREAAGQSAVPATP
jgi:PiT family inorganic phosphate transporter